jgi:spartin
MRYRCSRGIVLATGAVTTGMSAASSYYIAHTKPNEKPLEFSESTRGHVRRIHKISGQAVTVSSKTTAMIGECVDRAVGYLAGGSDQKSPSRPTTPTPSASTSRFSFFTSRPSSPAPPLGAVSSPPLPPRDANTRYLSPQPQPQPGTITPGNANAPPPLPPRPPLKNRILLSTDLLLTTIENSAKHLVEHGSTKLSEALGHK